MYQNNNFLCSLGCEGGGECGGLVEGQGIHELLFTTNNSIFHLVALNKEL